MTKLENLRIAVQKNGRLREASLNFLRTIGLTFDLPTNGELIVPCANAPVELLLVRNSDISEYVTNGIADFGIVGENILVENERPLPVVKKLGFGICKLIIAVPKGSRSERVEDLAGERIATSYPNSLKKFLRAKGIPASLIVIQGSVEIAPELGLADAVCDITQTGNTLKAHGLIPIATVLESEAVLVESPNANRAKEEFIKKFVQKI